MSLRSIFTRFNKKSYKLSRLDIIVLIVGLAVFAAISLATIGQSSIWFDEAFSAYIIRFNPIEIWQYTSVDVHPPLYYWLLKLWSLIFGMSDVALRSMSVLFSGVAVVFGYLIIHKAFGRKAAIYALLAMVLSPVLIRYSQEMRMYTLVLAIALSATYVLQRAVENGKRKSWIIYGILVSLGMWTHYFAAIVWLAHWLWRAIVTAKGKNIRSKQFLKAFFSRDWVIAHVVAVGLFLPWLPFLVIQLLIVQAFGFWIPPVSPVTLTNFFTNTIFYLDQSGLVPWLTLGFVLMVIMSTYLSVRAYRDFNKPQKMTYWLLLVLAFAPPAILVVASMPPLQSSFVDRYLVTSSIVISILLGLVLWFSTQYKKRIIPILTHVLIIGASIIGIISVYSYGNYNKTTGEASGAKQIMSQVIDKANPGDPIVASSMWLYYDAVFYETSSHKVWFVDTGSYEYGSLEMLRTRDYGKISDISKFKSQNKTFWYVARTGEKEPNLPFDNIEQVQALQQSDPFTGKPAYKAIQYRVISE